MTVARYGVPQSRIVIEWPIGSMPAGQNASGETRRELYDWYWRGTIEPRSTSYDEVIQVHILSRYEQMMGATYRFETELPDLDDASSLLEKAGAFKSLQALGAYNQKIHVLSEMNKTIACSVEKAKSELGYRPAVSLEEGMRRSLQWVWQKQGGLDGPRP